MSAHPSHLTPGCTCTHAPGAPCDPSCPLTSLTLREGTPIPTPPCFAPTEEALATATCHVEFCCTHPTHDVRPHRGLYGQVVMRGFCDQHRHLARG